MFSHLILSLAVSFAAFCVLLFVLSKIMPDFKISVPAIPMTALILAAVDSTVGWGLVKIVWFPKAILSVLTLGLAGLIINWIINVIVFWLADKFSEALTIKSTQTLFVSAAALQFTDYWVRKFV